MKYLKFNQRSYLFAMALSIQGIGAANAQPYTIVEEKEKFCVYAGERYSIGSRTCQASVEHACRVREDTGKPVWSRVYVLKPIGDGKVVAIPGGETFDSHGYQAKPNDPKRCG